MQKKKNKTEFFLAYSETFSCSDIDNGQHQTVIIIIIIIKSLFKEDYILCTYILIYHMVLLKLNNKTYKHSGKQRFVDPADRVCPQWSLFITSLLSAVQMDSSLVFFSVHNLCPLPTYHIVNSSNVVCDGTFTEESCFRMLWLRVSRCVWGGGGGGDGIYFT